MTEHTNHTDQDLIALLNEGDHCAFEAIYKRYATGLFRYARKTISKKEECEEIVQEVFVSLWERRESLRILSLKHYLFHAVRYKVIHCVRHSKVRLKFEEHFRLFEMICESADKEELSEDSRLAALLTTLSDLPERCQQAMKLRLLENLSNGQIAERMHISKKTVEVYMLKAFDHLRAHYHSIYNS
jgi:RNA polymerase sigma-70 factor (ECF subfamily)